MIKGIRRAEEGTPRCGVPPPRGARARASASAERKQAAARAENPFLSALHMIKGIRRAEEGTPQCGVPPPRGARARASASAERKQAAARAENPFLCAASEQALHRLLRLFHCMIKAGARSHRCSSFPQKVSLGSPARLQARSQRLAIAANLLREQSGRPMHRMGLPLCI